MRIERVSDWTRPAMLRAMLRDAALVLPGVLVAGVAAWRRGGVLSLIAVLVVGVLLAGASWWRARQYDRAWLVTALDAARGDLEDSSDLIFADPAGLGPLQRLQRGRVAARLAAAVPDLAPRWPVASIAGLWLAALVTVAALLWWPASEPAVLAPAAEGGPVVPGVPRLVGQRLTVVPPAYTGLPARPLDTLDARVPVGSRLEWTLRFDPVPAGAAIVSPEGTRLPLVRDGDWTAQRVAERSFLYRVVAEGGATPPLHRIDVVADEVPRIRVVAPSRTLTQVTAGQRGWTLGFEVTDDYGVAPAARLRLVLAQGEGENVSFRERALTLRASGDARRRRFGASVDLAALGFRDAGDLVAQLIVADSHGQVVRGPSLILRRPPAALAESGLEASVRRVMPAYFTSQRQIIIDAEALIAQRARLAPEAFVAKSDAIGADQRLLRLRYGQFMGEETGGGATAAMPTSDAEEGATPAHSDDDGHDHKAGPATFGDAGDVTAEYGHTHDESEAATLLDPGTRATLRKVLDAMWQSELALRQGEPRKALGPANTALRFLKQVQQATRVFLARTGTQLPSVDEGRRLTGKRDGIAPALPALVVEPVDASPAAAWRGLASGVVPLEPLTRWLRANEGRVADPLALSAAIDAVRRDPACGACRQRLRGALWSVLARSAPGVRRRADGGASGRRYVEALR
ncbi:DUF4175 domain-containing protein [Sphingomonas sp. KR1UV-12]|uniref:DUF4175 domain-containing protein n=1 Tax=Sphingomonas aurea TaxID=3063994 RepID=A0ABT9EIF4_9SPHN|nr:DUF4175 domain-containing protein [Sphingomonas sp. KR1UV-12]MDP1026742.1 DUF4175 domain-containing protein [Sphingomonas sp. KR1UV-12]